jgi:hypothetical protein
VHEPIIERELWDKVHAVLARDSHARSVDTKIRSRNDALLRGLLYVHIPARRDHRFRMDVTEVSDLA